MKPITLSAASRFHDCMLAFDQLFTSPVVKQTGLYFVALLNIIINVAAFIIPKLLLNKLLL